MKKTKKALLYGISSYKNRGVEALATSTLCLLDEKYDEVFIASYDPPYNTKFYNASNHHYVQHYRSYDELTLEEQKKIDYYGTIPFDYFNFEQIYQKQVFDVIDDVDICISSGGDNYCYDSSNWLYALSKEIKRRGKTSVLWGASLFEKIDDLELIDSLKQFDILLIRESISYEALKKYIPEKKMLLAPDPAFGLDAKRIEVPNWYQKRDVVGINLSPLTIQTEEQYQDVQKFLDYILKETSYSIALIPHVLIESNDDREILEKLYEKYQDEERVRLENVEKFQYQEIKYLISNFKFMIAARTHLSISAYANLIPTLVIGYSVKSRGIAKDLFGSYNHYVLSKNSISYDRLVQEFSYLVKHANEISDILKEKMKEYVPKSKSLLDLVLERVEENKKRIICNVDDCIGCAACYHTCPHHAIEMKKNQEGFLVPEIDFSKCTSCNLCRNVCPVLKGDKKKIYDAECYAVKNKDKKVVEKSSSGGVFSLLAATILKKGGFVYGVSFQDGRTQHIRIDNEDELFKIQGSKYTQSSMVEILPQIKKDLASDQLVLFSGTACQVSALKSFLRKDYPNLYCVSVICHGVINDEIWGKYMNELGVSKDNYDYFKFRDKGNGWNRSSISYIKNDKKRVVEFLDDPLMYLYLRNYILRKSCYHCKFKGLENIESDLILGDYWGIHLCHPDFFDKKGISSVIVNSKKGKKLMNMSQFFDQCEVLESKLEYVYEHNPMILKSVEFPKERHVIFEQLNCNEMATIVHAKKLQEEKEKLSQELHESYEKIAVVSQKADLSDSLQNELEKIYYSRRWQIPTKIIDTIKRKK